MVWTKKTRLVRYLLYISIVCLKGSAMISIHETRLRIVRNHSHESEFDLHENETACRTHFHIKGFALRLVLKQRHQRTWK